MCNDEERGLTIVLSRPDQDLDLLYDYIVQILSGRNQDIKIHIVAINASEDVQVRKHFTLLSSLHSIQ